MKKNTPGCSLRPCCGPCCATYWPDAQGVISGVEGELNGLGMWAGPLVATKSMPAIIDPNTLCSLGVILSECDSTWSPIRCDGPTSCNGGPGQDSWGVFKMASATISGGGICNGSSVTPIVFGASATVIVEVTCDSYGNPLWSLSMNMSYSVQFLGDCQSTPTGLYRPPSDAQLLSWGYTYMFSGLTFLGYYRDHGDGTSSTYSTNRSGMYFVSGNYTDVMSVGAGRVIYGSSAADLMGVAGTLSPYYNPLSYTLDYGVI